MAFCHDPMTTVWNYIEIKRKSATSTTLYPSLLKLREKSEERLSFNHGVEGLSPSARTMNLGFGSGTPGLPEETIQSRYETIFLSARKAAETDAGYLRLIQTRESAHVDTHEYILPRLLPSTSVRDAEVQSRPLRVCDAGMRRRLEIAGRRAVATLSS
jgi:hypothetical protein